MVVYCGPSRFRPGVTIVAILTGVKTRSSNRKTGRVAQLTIIQVDNQPSQSRANDDESATCGSCPLMGATGICYVNLGQSVDAIWRAYHRGVYQHWSDDFVRLAARRCSGLRLGLYGDAGALPQEVIERLCAVFREENPTAPILGYTHAWRRRDCQWLARFAMASVETWQGAIDAGKRGWRVFFAGAESERPAGLIECPADSHGRQCADCGLCQGTHRPARSVYIKPHGAKATLEKLLDLVR